jgi:hypothetical protein
MPFDVRTQEVSMIRRTGLALIACVATTAIFSAPSVAQADVIQDWNVIAQNETVLLRPSAHGQTRGTAMVEGAVYDAVNAIDRGHQPYLLDFDDVNAQPWVSQDAAAATAAYRVLKAITPVARHAGLDTAYGTTLLGIPDGPIEQGGVAAGEAAAAAMIAARQNDGFMAAFNPVTGIDPGDWRPLGWPATPAFDPDGWVGNEKPFLIKDPSRYRSKGPNSLRSKAYERDFDEVKEIGALNSSTRTADQTAAAVFWQAAPAPVWNTLLRSLANRYHLDTADQARLYGMVNLAGADAAIACWNDKYYWSFWRPRAAIREADTDGNPRTIADPGWEPLFAPATVTTPALITPAFPDHPSGHGCLSGAVLKTIANFFGTDKVEIEVVAPRSLNGVPIPARHFERLSDALDEIIEARIWGGIHFRTADVQGAVIGKKVARYVRKHYFRPLHCR